jgi:hypothetical protein
LENRIPIIYFLGIAPGRYQAMLPTFISGWDGRALKARVAFGAPDQETLALPETALGRRYALRAIKQRLHQASFREAVITAYNGRCALSGLPGRAPNPRWNAGSNPGEGAGAGFVVLRGAHRTQHHSGAHQHIRRPTFRLH